MDTERLLLPYRLRTVRTGVQATFLVVAGLLAYALIAPPGTVDAVPYFSLMAVTVVGGAVVAVLPWRRLFESGFGLPFMYAWSVLDILLITAIIAVTGGAASDFFWIYTLTAFFMASSYPTPSQVALLAFTYAGYLGVLVVMGEPLVASALIHRFTVLGVLVFMTSFLFRELMRRVTGHAEAQAESEGRARLLSTVAEAARSMSRLDSEVVLSSVVDATIGLGFDAAMLCVYAEDGRSYQVSQARGVPEDYAAAVYPSNVGVNSLVLERRETVVVANYPEHPLSVPALREAGFRAGLATPVWAQGRIVAVLACGAKRELETTPEEVEAIELLAAQAGRALENARLFEEERRAVARLAELDEMKKDFLSNVSHELRTPLTVIAGMGLTLEQRWDLLSEDRRKEFVHRVNANARALDDVIRTLLDFTQLDAGRITVRVEPIVLGPVLRNIAARLGSLFADRDLVVEAEPGCVVEADPHLLERVVENLLSNAAKYTPPGTRVTISATREGQAVTVTVTDDGPGIAPEDLRHIGERFFRGGDLSTRHTRGTGLGLAFVKEVLRLHGTSLRVRSDLGRGSRFSFELPLAAEPPSVRPAPRESLDRDESLGDRDETHHGRVPGA